MLNVLNTRISLRKDDLSNWISSNPILADGELAIIVDENGSESLKIGNGLSTFSQLCSLYSGEIKSKKLNAEQIEAKSISQGYNVKSTPTSLATGVFSEADGNFDVVHGIEAQALSTDDYAFVFNGTNLPSIADRYTSHGEGSFNINPTGGLNGFYIGQQNLSSLLSIYITEHQSLEDYAKRDQLMQVSSVVSNDVKNLADNYYKKSETSSASQLSSEFQKHQLSGDYALNSSISSLSSSIDNKVYIGNFISGNYDLSNGSNLSVVKINADDYYKLVAEDKDLSDVLYVVSSDNLNAHGQTIVNVAEPVLSNDAVNKIYLESKLSSIELSDYYKSSETSSANQISLKLKEYQLSGNYILSSNLSFNYDTNTKYIYLKAFGNDIGTVNCADFIKDGMLSTVQLIGNTLIFKFNTDAGITPISVNLSSFVDNYDTKIAYLSNVVSTDVKNLADNYYKKSDVTLNASGALKVGTTQITALTAHQSLTAYATKSELTGYATKSDLNYDYVSTIANNISIILNNGKVHDFISFSLLNYNIYVPVPDSDKTADTIMIADYSDLTSVPEFTWYASDISLSINWMNIEGDETEAGNKYMYTIQTMPNGSTSINGIMSIRKLNNGLSA